jgi:hypothetical protein
MPHTHTHTHTHTRTHTHACTRTRTHAHTHTHVAVVGDQPSHKLHGSPPHVHFLRTRWHDSWERPNQTAISEIVIFWSLLMIFRNSSTFSMRQHAHNLKPMFVQVWIEKTTQTSALYPWHCHRNLWIFYALFRPFFPKPETHSRQMLCCIKSSSNTTPISVNTQSKVTPATLPHLLSYKLCYLPLLVLVVSSGTVECAVLRVS